MAEVVAPLDPRDIVAPLLPSLPVAAIASQPSTSVLPLLSPILRQRVQFLSASSSEPWIRLLSYDPVKAAKLVEIARSARLEPHPVSGEIEIDWDSEGAGGDLEIRYKRLDVETLQALVLLRDLDLVFRLVHCDGDPEGGGPGWRIGEVSIPDTPHAFAAFGGHATVSTAERMFAEQRVAAAAVHATGTGHHDSTHNTSNDADDGDDDDDDDDYWARYDATPARTPAVKRSPAPASVRQTHAYQEEQQQQQHGTSDADDAYYAQYDSVQPAMDNHDPDEAMAQGLSAAPIPQPPPPLGMDQQGASEDPERARGRPRGDKEIDHERLAKLIHPRPASVSSHSSSGGGSAVLVTKLEESAGRQEQSEFGVKQHVSRSIKSLYLLARASGIDRDEFEQLVKTELDMLAMMEE